MRRLTLHAMCLALAASVPVVARPADEPTKTEAPAPLTAASAYENLAGWEREAITPEYIDKADKLFAAAAAAQPKDARWALGQGLVARARAERVKARELCKKAVELDPKSAAAKSWYGTTIFESINEAGFFEKMGLSDDGVEAYQEAVKLDPNRLDARIGLFQFYLQAPGIAGGSVKKAREHANAMLSLPGGGPYAAYASLGQLAAEDEDWPALAAACDNAVKAARTPRQAREAKTIHGNMLLKKKEDPAAAIPVLEGAAKDITAKDDTAPFFLLAEAHRELEHWDKARGYYAQVIEAKPDAANSRFWLAECCEKCGDAKAALDHYTEFVSRFPKDDRAGKAQSAIKRLKKKLGQ